MTRRGRSIDPDMANGVVVYKSVLFDAFMGVSEAFRSGDEPAIHDCCDWFFTLAMTHLEKDVEWAAKDRQALRIRNTPDFWDPEGPLPKECWRKRMAVAISSLAARGVLWFAKEAPVDEREEIETAMKVLGRS